MANKTISNKYWETETPIVIEGEKSVAKIYMENGKVQVFPKVANTKYGIGKGATMDLESMNKASLIAFKEEMIKAIDNQIEKAED